MERNVKKIFAEEVKTNLEPLYDYEKYPLGTLDYHLAKAKHHLKNAEMLIASGGTVEGWNQMKHYEIEALTYVKMRIEKENVDAQRDVCQQCGLEVSATRTHFCRMNY